MYSPEFDAPISAPATGSRSANPGLSGSSERLTTCLVRIITRAAFERRELREEVACNSSSDREIMSARALMILGTSSHAGKSLLTAALGRILADDGYRVAP